MNVQKFSYKVCAVVLLALVMTVIGNLFVFAVSEAQAARHALTKELRMPTGTTVPAVSFDFEFDPVRIDLSTTPLIRSMPTDRVPNIDDQRITFTATDPTAAVPGSPGTVAATRSLTPDDITALIDGMFNRGEFPAAGAYVWNVTEVPDSSGTNANAALGTMDYSDAQFQLRVWIENTDSDGLAIARIEIVPVRNDAGNLLTGAAAKRNTMNFINDYTPPPPVITTADLDISKMTEGVRADRTRPFNFVLNLTAPANAPITGTITATVMAGTPLVPVVPAQTVSISAGTNTFTLTHGQTLRIPELPIGTTFVVEEINVPAEYTPSVRITQTGQPVVNLPGTTGQNLSTLNRTLVAEVNQVAFTNTHEPIPITGLVLGTASLGLGTFVFLAALLAVSYVQVRHRKSIEEFADTYTQATGVTGASS